MKSGTVRILFVEDLPTDVEIAERELSRGGIAFVSERVETADALERALRTFKPDIVVSDYAMPSYDGMSALLAVKAFDHFLSFIILTGSMSEDTAVLCMKAGASDYVIKEHITRLPFAVREAIEHMELHRRSSAQEDLLRQSEERYRSIFADSNAVMLIIDPEDLTITEANGAAVEYYGWPLGELVGKKLTEINTLPPEALRERVRMAVSLERNHFQFRHRHADGTVTDVESHSGPVRIGDKVYLFSVIHDISLRLAAQAERDSISQKLAHYLSTSPTITYAIHLEGGAVHQDWTSENVESILGYTVQETMVPGWWFGNVTLSDRAVALGGIAELCRQDRFAHEYRFHRKDRTVVWIRDEMRSVHGESGGTEIVGTMTDITDRKRSEAEISLKGAALEASGDAVVITDREGNIEWANRAFETLTGYSKAEAIGMNPRDLVKSDRQDPSMYRELWDTILSGATWRGVLVNKRKSGELYDEEMTITPFMDAGQQIDHFIAIKNDVTEKIQSKLLLESSLREKEELLREVHHRVKNNMQIVSSLLSLSSDNLDDERSRQVIAELHRRVNAMAFVHEQFYEAADLSRIDFSLYLRQLVDNLRSDLPLGPGAPEVRYRLESLMLGLESAIPAGLVASELVSNALRFMAAPSVRPGVVDIGLGLGADGIVTLELRDNGVGLPPGFDPKTAPTLGMRLIEILSDQLRGSFSLSSGNGTTAMLRFPMPPPAPDTNRARAVD